MKKNIAIAAGVVALVLMSSASASAGVVVKLQAHIPFAFYAGQTLVPAGECSFELRPMSPHAASTSAVFVRGHNGIVAWIATMPGLDPDMGARLHFNRYGTAYFLSRVECAGLRATAFPTEAEQEYRAQTKVGNTVLVAAR